jgi:hypothetical protein
LGILAIGIEHPLDMTVQRLHDPRCAIVGPSLSKGIARWTTNFTLADRIYF